jgi:XTP/dITP diphosphohydrolase
VKLVLASNNAKKLAELQRLFDGLDVDLVAQGVLGVGDAGEPHLTYVENALAKARHAARATGLPAIADDSGLCVDALGGAPGVQSAVFAPLLSLHGDREAQRRARDDANTTLLRRGCATPANAAAASSARSSHCVTPTTRSR